MRTRTRSEAGVTLIELLVAVSLIGLLMVALMSAVFVGFRSTRDTHTSLDQSNTEQIITTYVTKDIQAADATAAAVTSPCGGLVALESRARSNPTSAAAPDITVTYRLDGTKLIRQVCGPTPSIQTLADNVTTFTASGTGAVLTTVTTAASTEVPAYQFSFEVRRRQA